MANEIIEGNKLIIDFIGIPLERNGMAYYIHKGYYGINELLFRRSWDWLMPVVEEIHILREVKEVSISIGRTRIWLTKGGFIQSPHKPENSNITECWLAVIEFLKWYNKNKQN